jgi:hypothetical protein
MLPPMIGTLADLKDYEKTAVEAYGRACARVGRDAALQHPAAPSVPPSVAGDAGELPELQRYGRGPKESPYLLVPMNDGYWTPWHIAQDTIRRLATAEQPGSAVQGEAKPAVWVDADDLEHGVERGSFMACSDDYYRTRPNLRYNVPLYTTPPPAPAAEQGEDAKPYRCDFCGADYGKQACCQRRYEYLTQHGRTIRLPSIQPEARGVEGMVNRFLCWKLPDDFAPDAGISFTPSPIQSPGNLHWPVGTNLLTAAQARAMFEHCLAAAPSDVRVDGMVSLTAIKEVLQPLTDGRSTHNVHTRQVARDILQRIAALTGKEGA